MPRPLGFPVGLQLPPLHHIALELDTLTVTQHTHNTIYITSSRSSVNWHYVGVRLCRSHWTREGICKAVEEPYDEYESSYVLQGCGGLWGPLVKSHLEGPTVPSLQVHHHHRCYCRRRVPCPSMPSGLSTIAMVLLCVCAQTQTQTWTHTHTCNVYIPLCATMAVRLRDAMGAC